MPAIASKQLNPLLEMPLGLSILPNFSRLMANLSSVVVMVDRFLGTKQSWKTFVAAGPVF